MYEKIITLEMRANGSVSGSLQPLFRGESLLWISLFIHIEITCTFCKKLYIGETGRRLGDRFREHLCDIEKDDKDASKPVAQHFNLPQHSKSHMAICGLLLLNGCTERRKTLEQSRIHFLNRHPQSSWYKRTFVIQLIYIC